MWRHLRVVFVALRGRQLELVLSWPLVWVVWLLVELDVLVYLHVNSGSFNWHYILACVVFSKSKFLEQVYGYIDNSNGLDDDHKCFSWTLAVDDVNTKHEDNRGDHHLHSYKGNLVKKIGDGEMMVIILTHTAISEFEHMLLMIPFAFISISYEHFSRQWTRLIMLNIALKFLLISKTWRTYYRWWGWC